MTAQPSSLGVLIFFDEQEVPRPGEIINIYKRQITLSDKGTYLLKVKIDFPKSMAYRFSYLVRAFISGGGGSDIIGGAGTFNQAVAISDELEINVPEDNYYSHLEIEMKLSATNQNIEENNYWEFSFKEGLLNLFPPSFTLAPFLPRITCKEFIDRIKTFLNLRIDVIGNTVAIDYIEQSLPNITYIDYTNDENEFPTRRPSENTVFRLTLENETEIIVNSQGVVFNTSELVPSEIEDINIEVLPVPITDELDRITAKYPDNESDLMLALYDGPVDSYPLCVDMVNGETLKLDSLYERLWKLWLKFRTNSETYRDKFVVHISREVTSRHGIYMYNKAHIIKKLRKKLISDQYWEVEIETETL